MIDLSKSNNPLVPDAEKTEAALVHALGGALLAIGPLAFWFRKPPPVGFARLCLVEALNWQLFVTPIALLCFSGALGQLGYSLIGLLLITNCALCFYGSYCAGKGQFLKFFIPYRLLS